MARPAPLPGRWWGNPGTVAHGGRQLGSLDDPCPRRVERGAPGARVNAPSRRDGRFGQVAPCSAFVARHARARRRRSSSRRTPAEPYDWSSATGRRSWARRGRSRHGRRRPRSPPFHEAVAAGAADACLGARAPARRLRAASNLRLWATHAARAPGSVLTHAACRRRHGASAGRRPQRRRRIVSWRRVPLPATARILYCSTTRPIGLVSDGGGSAMRVPREAVCGSRSRGGDPSAAGVPRRHRLRRSAASLPPRRASTRRPLRGWKAASASARTGGMCSAGSRRRIAAGGRGTADAGDLSTGRGPQCQSGCRLRDRHVQSSGRAQPRDRAHDREWGSGSWARAETPVLERRDQAAAARRGPAHALEHGYNDVGVRRCSRRRGSEVPPHFGTRGLRAQVVGRHMRGVHEGLASCLGDTTPQRSTACAALRDDREAYRGEGHRLPLGGLGQELRASTTSSREDRSCFRRSSTS